MVINGKLVRDKFVNNSKSMSIRKIEIVICKQ